MHTYTHTHACMHAHACMLTHTHTHTHTHTCTHTHTHTWIHFHVYDEIVTPPPPTHTHLFYVKNSKLFGVLGGWKATICGCKQQPEYMHQCKFLCLRRHYCHQPCVDISAIYFVFFLFQESLVCVTAAFGVFHYWMWCRQRSIGDQLIFITIWGNTTTRSLFWSVALGQGRMRVKLAVTEYVLLSN